MKAWLGKPRHHRYPHQTTLRSLAVTRLLAISLLLFGELVTSQTAFADLPAPLARSTSLAEIPDEDLAEISGQALLSVQKRIGDGGFNGDTGLTFTRIAIGAKIEVNANIEHLELGNYPIPSEDGHFWNVNGKDADIKATNVSFGCISCPAGQQDMVMEDPYIEFAYKNDGTVNRKLVGVRIGFDKLSGWLSGNLESLSGDLSGELCLFGSFACIPGGSHGPRSGNLTGSALGISASVPWRILHALPIGNVGNGDEARNFYFGFQTQNLNYPKNGNGPQEVAKPGFWINLEDGLNLTLSSGIGALFAKDNAYGPIAPSVELTSIVASIAGIPLWFPIIHSPAVAARM